MRLDAMGVWAHTLGALRGEDDDADEAKLVRTPGSFERAANAWED
jgi:hypothetical protein